MRPPGPALFLLQNEDQASRFGAALGSALRPGDTVLLQGPVGAGKSHLARAAIRAICGAETEVPSPSFTLVQVYPGPECEVWHTDLYRLTDPDEMHELGLTEAMQDAIVLIEWPELLGRFSPDTAIRIQLAPEGDTRRVSVLNAGPSLLRALTGALK